jgi:hypothetical protein
MRKNGIPVPKNNHPFIDYRKKGFEDEESEEEPAPDQGANNGQPAQGANDGQPAQGANDPIAMIIEQVLNCLGVNPNSINVVQAPK